MNTITLPDTPENRRLKEVFDHLIAHFQDQDFLYQHIPGAHGDKSAVLVTLKSLGLRESVAAGTFRLTPKAKSTRIELCVSQPLPDAGEIDPFAILWSNKERDPARLGCMKEVPEAPDRPKPASERTRDLPDLTSFAELRKLVQDRFILRSTDFEYDYWMTPEELCDIVERYAEMIEVQFSEYCCPRSEDLCCVRLFQKNPPEGEPIELNGLFPFFSESDADEFLREYKSAPRYARELPRLAGIEGKYQFNFGKGAENPRDITYEKENENTGDISLAENTCAARALWRGDSTTSGGKPSAR